jgi:hypothetical protein
MSGAFLCLAKPNSTPAPAVPVGDVVRTMLDARLDATAPQPVLAAQAARILRRALWFDVSAVFWVTPDRPTSLTLAMTEGLPSEFADIARSLSLADYDQVADLPYNDDHASCYGDFFASVVGTFGIRSWLVASLIDKITEAVIGAILLGARDGKRFDSRETQMVQSLTGRISANLSGNHSEEDDHGLASFDAAA